MPSLKHKNLLVVFVAATTLLLPVSSRAGLEENYPPETLAYAYWAGRSIVFDGSDFGKILLQQPDIERLLKLLTTGNGMDAGKRDTIVRLARMWSEAWQCPCAAGLVGITDDFVPRLVVTIDLGEKVGEFRNELDMIAENLSEGTTQIAPSTKSGRGIYRMLTGNDETAEISVGFIDSVFFAAMGEKGFTIKFLEKKAKKSIVEEKKYKNSMKAVAGENIQFSLYIDVAGITGQLKELEGKKDNRGSELQLLLDALGVKSIDSIATTAIINKKQMCAKIRITNTAPHTGILSLFTGMPLTQSDLSVVPSDTVFFAALNISPLKVQEEIHRAAKIIGSDAEDSVKKTEKKIDGNLGLSLTNDILPVLGDTFVLYCSERHGGFPTGMVLAVELADPKKAEAVSTRLESLAKAPAKIRKMQSGKTEIRYLVSGKENTLVMPAWTISENRVYLALWPQVLAGVFEDKITPILSHAPFEDLRAGIAGKSSILCYVDFAVLAQRLYPFQLLLSSSAANLLDSQIPDKEWLLIAGDTLQKELDNLQPGVFSVSSDKEGITVESIGAGASWLLCNVRTFLAWHYLVNRKNTEKSSSQQK